MQYNKMVDIHSNVYSINRKGDCSREKVMVAMKVVNMDAWRGDMFMGGELEMFTGKVE